MIKKKKIFFFTGSRADYGIMSELLKKINLFKEFNLFLVVNSMHISKKYGFTLKEIKKNNFKIIKTKSKLKKYDSVLKISQHTSSCIKEFSNILSKKKPDLVIILGDRTEAFAAAFSALSEKTPIAHFHGGESTKASLDDALRHSITKMSTFHFTSNKVYKRRIIQMGENPKNIFNIGSLGVDNIKRIHLMKKQELERKFNFNFKKNNFLLTFHPETLSHHSIAKKLKLIFIFLSKHKETNLFFCLPNADAGGDEIRSLIIDFCSRNKMRFKYFNSLGQEAYFSMLKYCNLVIGNSSSGIIEVPSFKIATIDVGSRQQGRIRAKSVLNSTFEIKNFIKIFYKARSKKFINSIKNIKNPYLQKNSIQKAFKILTKLNLSKDLVQKEFYDIKKGLS